MAIYGHGTVHNLSEMAKEFCDNHFLARLPQDTIERLSPGFEWVSLAAGELHACEMANSVYFPTEGLVSFVLEANDGATFEAALAGNESLLGISTFLNSPTPLIPTVVQRPVLAIKLDAQKALEEFRLGMAFQYQVMNYLRVFIRQVTQTSLCNARHSLEQRFCRWLLLSQERLDVGDHVAMSQEMIAGLLGVRREAVTRVARRLKAQNVIDYTSRRIEIVDREGLEQAACCCYQTLRNEFNELCN